MAPFGCAVDNMYRTAQVKNGREAQALYSSFRFKETSNNALTQPGPASYDCTKAKDTRIPHQLYRTDRQTQMKPQESCRTQFLYNVQQPLSAVGAYSLKSSTKFIIKFRTSFKVSS